MRLPDPFAPRKFRSVPPKDAANWDAAMKKFHRKDSQVRMHALANHVAALPGKVARQEYVAQMAAKLPEIRAEDRARNAKFISQFKKLVVWYWRARRKTKTQQG
jgi:hypothetical protein